MNIKWQDCVSNLQVLDMAESTSRSRDPEKLPSLGWTCHSHGRQQTTKVTDVWGARKKASGKIQKLRKDQHKSCRNQPQGV